MPSTRKLNPQAQAEIRLQKLQEKLKDRRSPCRTPAKKKYATREAAEAIIPVHIALSKRGTTHLHAYLCSCDWWHLTSRPENVPKKGSNDE